VKRLAAVLLAAGASSRMGRAKPLLEWEGERFLDRQIGLYAEFAAPVVVVLGHEAESIAAGLQRTEQAEFVLNPRPARGMLSSLQCGLRALAGRAEGVLFLPVDSPGVRPATVAALAAAWRGSEALLVVPEQDGRRGHPVLADARVWPEFLALAAEATPREVVGRHRAETLRVPVDDASIHLDIDDAAAYQALRGEKLQ